MQSLNKVIQMMQAEGLPPAVLVKTPPAQLAGDDLPVSDCELIVKASTNIFGSGGKYADLANEKVADNEWSDIKGLIAAEIEKMSKQEQPANPAPVSRFAVQQPKANGSTPAPAQVPVPDSNSAADPNDPIVNNVERFIALNAVRVAQTLEPPIDFVPDQTVDRLGREGQERFEGRTVTAGQLKTFMLERLPDMMEFQNIQRAYKDEAKNRGWDVAPAPKSKSQPLTPTDMAKGVVGNSDFTTAVRYMVKHRCAAAEILDDQGFSPRGQQAPQAPTSRRFGGPA